MLVKFLKPVIMSEHASVSSIPSHWFYGKNRPSILKELPETSERIVDQYPFKYLNIDSPSSTWRLFRKQADALHFAKERMNGMMTFVCQSGTSGERRFLVAHPRVFWFYDCRKDVQRCSYEIISAESVCKLYFDLEFSKETNPSSDGIKMTDVFIQIISYHLQEEWGIAVTKEHVLELDSSTDKKFSCHLIYQIPNVVFQNNYHVGNFVKKICDNLRLMKAEDSDECSHFIHLGISKEDVLSLFIESNGKQKLFCDEGVYTKNRHFRLYLSSKWNKNAPLVRSRSNKWLSNCSEDDEQLFLDSLISYLSFNREYRVLCCFYSSDENKRPPFSPQGLPHCVKETEIIASPYPEVDRFIAELVTPGRIYRSHFFAGGNCVVYDIIGNRFCKNIGREHRRNNIKFIVDLNKKSYYQKCYDPDCKGYRSESFLLPPELIFILEGPLTFDASEIDNSSWQNEIPEEQLSEILNCVESSSLL